jgi:hypothetical protein
MSILARNATGLLRLFEMLTCGTALMKWAARQREWLESVSRSTASELEPSVSSAQVQQKNYEMPRRTGSASRIFSPSPTSSGRSTTTKRSSVLALHLKTARLTNWATAPGSRSRA